MTTTKYFEKVETNRDGRFSMNNSPRIKFLTLCIGAALAQMAGVPALADTAVGVDTVNGNAANPGYLAVPRELDEEMSVVKRSPSGQMYSIQSVDMDTPEAAGAGPVKGSVDIGYTHQSDSKTYAKRSEYTDFRNGVYINNFNISQDLEGLRYYNINAGGVGRKDQFYDITTGKYGSWKVKTFYNETMHIFTDTWKHFYNGEGTGNLTTGLPAPTMVSSGAYTAGQAGYVGATATCTAAAPCWRYNGVVYGNAVALQAINGVLGTYNSAGALVPATATAASTGQVQSNMAAAIAAKLAATPYSELSLVRKKGGVRGDVNLSDSVKAYASYTLEKRVGSRPFSVNDGNNISFDFAEPIDYKTHDLLAGLSYADDLTQANLRASASVFRNNINTLTVQNPLLGAVTANGVIQHSTLVLAPDNNAFNVKGEFARSLPELWKARFTAAASWGTNRQNDALIAPISDAQNADLAAAGLTTIAGANAGYATNTMQISNWNTVAALSQPTAKQRIDNKLVDLGLSLKPVDDLAVKATYRFYDTANKGGYIAYNPLTGQFGRGPSTANGPGAADLVIAPSGVGTGCYTLPGYPAPNPANNGGATCSAATLANGSNIPVFAQARSTRQYNYGLQADYDLTRTQSLNGAIEREEFNRDFRERARTWENKIKVGYVNRDLWITTLRVSFENDTKRGGEYRYRTFEDLGTGLPGLDPATQIAVLNGTITPPAGVTYPALNANLFSRYSYYFRKYDQADRNQNILNTRLNVAALEDLDVGLNLQLKRANYPNSFYGLKQDNQDSLGLDFNLQASAETILSAFYNFQRGYKTMQMNSGVAGAAACTLANIAAYGYAACSDTTTGLNGARPYSDIWNSYTTDRNNVLGMGLQQDLGFATLGLDYTFTHSMTHITYDYGNTGYGNTAFSANAANNAAMAALAGTALPDMTTRQHTLTANLVKNLNKNTSIRAMYRFDGFRVKDWHYDSVIHNAMAAYDGNAGTGNAGTLLLDSGPLNYHVSTFGVFLNYKM
jgi:hypothetical protein